MGQKRSRRCFHLYFFCENRLVNVHLTLPSLMGFNITRLQSVTPDAQHLEVVQGVVGSVAINVVYVKHSHVGIVPTGSTGFVQPQRPDTVVREPVIVVGGLELLDAAVDALSFLFVLARAEVQPVLRSYQLTRAPFDLGLAPATADDDTGACLWPRPTGGALQRAEAGVATIHLTRCCIEWCRTVFTIPRDGLHRVEDCGGDYRVCGGATG
jgi:hypothetical protein